MISLNNLIKSRPVNNLRLHFRRFEFKYLISPVEAEKIKSYLALYTVRDPFVEGTGKDYYEVLSLYYDSPFFYYYNEKRDGIKKRKKIRLRTYRNNGVFSPYVFFEIKRKDDVIVSKDRFMMSVEDYQTLRTNGDLNHLRPAVDTNTQDLIREFLRERAVRAIRPVLFVVYDREPYVGKFNSNVRITFDSNLRGAENDDVLYSGKNLVDVLGPMVILELKFNGTLPFYIHNAIKIFNLQRIAYSKYCSGIERCGSLSLATYPSRYMSRVYSSLT